VFEADDNDDASSYDFDLLFTRRRDSTAADATRLTWLLAPARTGGFTACLWLRLSTSLTRGSIISLLSASRTTMTSSWSQDDRCDVTVTTDSRQVKPSFMFLHHSRHRTTEVPGLSQGVVRMILYLAVLT